MRVCVCVIYITCGVIPYTRQCCTKRTHVENECTHEKVHTSIQNRHDVQQVHRHGNFSHGKSIIFRYLIVPSFN